MLPSLASSVSSPTLVLIAAFLALGPLSGLLAYMLIKRRDPGPLRLPAWQIHNRLIAHLAEVAIGSPVPCF